MTRPNNVHSVFTLFMVFHNYYLFIFNFIEITRVLFNTYHDYNVSTIIVVIIRLEGL